METKYVTAFLKWPTRLWTSLQGLPYGFVHATGWQAS